jgi:hypothetical protein
VCITHLSPPPSILIDFPASFSWIDNRIVFDDNLKNVRSEAVRHFRNKEKAFLKAKFEEIKTNSKIKNIRDLNRGINDSKKGYHPGTNIVKDEKGNLVADSHSMLARCRNISPIY